MAIRGDGEIDRATEVVAIGEEVVREIWGPTGFFSRWWDGDDQGCARVGSLVGCCDRVFCWYDSR